MAILNLACGIEMTSRGIHWQPAMKKAANINAALPR